MSILSHISKGEKALLSSIFLLACFFFVAYLNHVTKDSNAPVADANHEERMSVTMKSIGQVSVGEVLEVASLGSATEATSLSVEVVYNTYCATCHALGLVGAPATGDAEAWAPRIAKGIAVLVMSSTNGIGAMPAKGGCVDCTSSDLEAAIKFMIPSGL